MARGVVVVVDGRRVALIRRLSMRSPQPYYLFPGGSVEAGETYEEAARREALEELGLEVRIARLLAISDFRGNEQHYYLAGVTGGAFGTGRGEEMGNAAGHPNGTYTPVWLELAELELHDVRPRSLAALLQDGPPAAQHPPLRLTD